MKIFKKRLEPISLARMFPPPNAKFAAEKFGSEVSEGRLGLGSLVSFFRKIVWKRC